MKFFHTFIMVLLGLAALNAQVPNGSFEVWPDDFGPEGWYSNNFPEVWTTVGKSTDAYDGSYATRMEIANFNGGPMYPVLGTVFEIEQVNLSVTGYYRFHPVSNEQSLVLTAFYFSDGSLLGSGFLEVETAAVSYTPFSIDVSISGTDSPDSMMIQFELLSNSTTNTGIGSYALIDQVSLGQATGVGDVETPLSYSLKQNYPNPFNPSTTIEFSVARDSYVDIKVINALGKEVASPVKDNYPAGSYKVNFFGDNLPSGVYFYKIQAGNFSAVKKLVLIK